MTPLDFADIPAVLAPAVEELVRNVKERQPTLLMGPPGCGKTMLARRAPGLLSLDDHAKRWLEAEYDAAYGASHTVAYPVAGPPFRSPHHTISARAVVGNDKIPGELALARFGVLFLDELTEFLTMTLEVIRRGLDSMGDTAPILIAADGPCYCGFHGSTVRECRCPAVAIERHVSRVNKALDILGITRIVKISHASTENFRERGKSTAELRAMSF